MDKKTYLEIKRVCPSCEGTGLYVGMAEHDGYAVVCSTCKGTGCQVVAIETTPFEGRKERKDITNVLQHNPGIGVGNGEHNEYKGAFGGMSYEDWAAGKPFPPKSEMRKFSCPCWWYQAVDYDKKPKWKECAESLGRSFSDCKCFKTKEQCWKKWDEEHKNEGGKHE